MKSSVMKRLVLLLVSVLTLIAQPAVADLLVLACEPEWGSLTQELGGDNVEIYSATTAFQDPHRIEARPSLIAQTRLANLLVCSGAELEIGCLPLLLRQSSNGNIQPGGPGYVEASSLVQRLEIPSRVDRSMGDVHPGGNPHVHLDPRRVLKIAAVLSARMQQLDPDEARTYQARFKGFKRRLTKAIARWEAQAKPLKGVPVVVHHKNFTYLFDWLGIKAVGVLEPKPGIPPTATHLAQLVSQLQTQPAKMVIRAAYESDQASQFLSERLGIPAVMLPYTIGGTPAADDLFGLFDDTIDRLLHGLKEGSR
jgi:zinc/manganese transport system substrate-binding protein